MRQKLCLALITYLVYCIDKEPYKALDHLKEQVGLLVEQQKKQNKQIQLNNNQNTRAASKAKKAYRKLLCAAPRFSLRLS